MPAVQKAVPDVKQKPRWVKDIIRNKWLYFMLVPGIIYYVIFKFYPATYLVIVFQDYFPTLGVTGSPWV